MDGDATQTKKKKDLAEISCNLADFNKIYGLGVVNTTFVVRPVRQTSHVCMRGKMTAKDTSSLKLTRNLVLYKNLTDLYRVFLPNRRQRLIIREQSPGHSIVKKS